MPRISLKAAKEQAEREIGRPVQARGFDTREFGDHVFNILFYRYHIGNDGDIDLGQGYRWKIWVDGRQTAGGIID